MEIIVLCLLFGVMMIFEGEDLSGYSINLLIQRYQKQTENEVAFELLRRYPEAGSLQGEIIWALLAPHQRDLARIVASMNEDPQEELQKLFVKLHELFNKGKFPHSSWKYWLARIVKNDLLNQKKRKNPIVSMPVEILPEAEAAGQDDEFNMNRLYDAIGKLAETQREVIKLRYGRQEGKLMTYKEIAAKMNCSVGQVHGYLDRAKENLRNYLNEPA